MELCILIPAKNESLTISNTIDNLAIKLGDIRVNYLVINDHSDDDTEIILENLTLKYSNFNYLNNSDSSGVGNAIFFGLKHWKGDVVALCMADGSDSYIDILKSFSHIEDDGFDCVFGSRFIKGGNVKNYPAIKLILNRVFNNYVKIRSSYSYNDFTNIFKTYRRSAINEIMPIESANFSIGLEMSLKAYKKQMNILVIPISWTQRSAGKSKLNLMKNFKYYMKTLKHIS
jgi:dolichol-phosphate mannosyltransferase